MNTRPAKRLRVSVFGLGYVGSVSACCWAGQGLEVIGVDSNQSKVQSIARGQSPIQEPGLSELLRRVVADGRLSATTSAAEAVRNSDVSCICVGTPNLENGDVDLASLRRVCHEIGAALEGKNAYHVVVVRSTVLPGTTQAVLVPALEEASGRSAGSDFGVVFNPEFLREGSAIADFHESARTVIGQLDERSGDIAALLYAALDTPLVRTDLGTAEMVKFTDNAFHALKVAFANEIGSISKSLALDSHQVMDLFSSDHRLNLSSAYLQPGAPFGGSCLPKDLRALVGHARRRDVSTPVLAAVLESNEQQKRRCLELIRRTGRRRIGVLGLSFKQGTDDLRESPAVELVETLVGKGFDVRVYDRSVSISALIGSNLAYIQRELPHLAALLSQSIDDVLENADVVVVTRSDPEFAKVPQQMRPGQLMIDLVRLPGASEVLKECYVGLAW